MDKRIMYVGIGLLFCGFFMGHIIAAIIFFGILTAGSMITLIMTASKSFKLWCGRWGFIIDLVMYICSVFAIVNVGVTVAGGLAVASLVFTLYRKFFLEPWYKNNRPEREPKGLGTIISNAWCSAMNFITNLFTSKKSLS